MYYKVVKDGVVLDVLDEVRYVKYQNKHGIFLVCHPKEGQGIYSSDCKTVWHLPGLSAIPAEGYETVELVEIGLGEYERRKNFNGQTADEIIDAYTALLIQGDKYQLIDSLSRCFKKEMLSKSDINKLNNILTTKELNDIFSE